IKGDNSGGGNMSMGGGGTLNVWPHTFHLSVPRSTDMILHETAHTYSDNLWGGSSSDPRWQKWKDAAASDVNAPSSYGLCGPGSSVCREVKDDFAETY